MKKIKYKKGTCRKYRAPSKEQKFELEAQTNRQGKEPQVNGTHQTFNRITAAESAPHHCTISPALGKYFYKRTER